LALELAVLSELEAQDLIADSPVVLGDPFDPVVAVAVAEISQSAGLFALDEAAAVGLVQPARTFALPSPDRPLLGVRELRARQPPHESADRHATLPQREDGRGPHVPNPS
jgi:hypothetical protein